MHVAFGLLPRLHALFGVQRFKTPRCQVGSRMFASVQQQMAGAAVSTQWLADRLDKVRVVDASWYMPMQKRDPCAEYLRERIPGAVFFDIDGVKDQSSSLPHMLPSEDAFFEAAMSMGFEDNLPIVVYSTNGLVGSARAWWTFRCFGLDSTFVLDGGFGKWSAENRPVERDAEPRKGLNGGLSKPKLRPELVRSLQQMIDNTTKRESIVIDARSRGRFDGTDPEPRPGLPSGHIPGSLNVPFTEIVDPEVGTLKSHDELRRIFEDAGVDLQKKPKIVTTCGSGVTAAILSAGLYELGLDSAVYDGAWSEYGASDAKKESKSDL